MADEAEQARKKAAEAAAKAERSRELAIRKAREEAAKSAVSLIVHSPAQK